jgi:hypothetical protein
MKSTNKRCYCTKGCFKIISRGLTLRLLEKIQDLKPGETFKLGGKEYLLDFISKKNEWENISIYIIDIKSDNLIRLSDHWSRGSNVKNCGYIATCKWSLLGSKKSKSCVKHVFEFYNYYYRYNYKKSITLCGGIINISKLKNI